MTVAQHPWLSRIVPNAPDGGLGGKGQKAAKDAGKGADKGGKDDDHRDDDRDHDNRKDDHAADGHPHGHGQGHDQHGQGQGNGHDHHGGHDDDNDDDHGGHGGSCGNAKPQVSVSSVTVLEGGYALVTVSLSEATRHTVHVDYKTLDGTARAGLDYSAVNGRLTFKAGETTTTIRIPIKTDTLDEAHETFTLKLTKATGAEIAGPGTGTVTILDDDAPVVAGPLAATVSEDDSVFSLDLLTGVTDGNGDQPWIANAASLTRADGTPVAYQVTGSTFSVDPGQFTDLAAGTSETVVLTFDVTDGSGTAPRSLTLAVQGANDVPVASDIAATIGEDGPAGTFAFVATDVDRGAALTYGLLTQPDSGTVINLGDGTFAFSPNGDFEDLALGESRAVSFTYRVTDEHGAASDATATVTVIGSNDGPVASDLSVSVAEDGPAGTFALPGTDIDAGAVLTYEALTQPAEGVLTVNADGTVSFDPAGAFEDLALGESRNVSFTYRVTDEHGATSDATATVTVIGSNDGPVASDLSVSVAEDGPAGTFALPGTDVDAGAVLTYEALTQPTEGVLTVNADGTFAFDPAGAFEDLHDGESRSVSFAYRVTDEHGVSAQAIASVLVLGINDDPDAVADRSATLMNSARTILAADLLANDTDIEGDTLTLVSVADGIGGTVGLDSDGNITFTPEAGFTGDARFTYTVSDGHGGFDVATVTVKVLTTQGNSAPIAMDDFLLGTCGDDILIDGDGVTTLVGGGGRDTLIGGGGDDTLLVTGDDVVFGGDGIDSVVVVGDAPATIDMGAAQVETVIGGFGSDTIVTAPTGGVVLAGGGDDTIVVSAGGGDSIVVGGSGTDTVVLGGDAVAYDYHWTGAGWTVTAPDGTRTTLSGVEVADFGDLDVEFDAAMRPCAFRVYEDVAVTIPKGLLLANDSDPDGDRLAIVSVQDAANANVALDANGDITFLGAPDYNGLATFTYTISDGNGGFDTATVTVRVWPVNDAPVIGDDGPFATDEDVTITIAASDLLANDSDIEGDTLTVISVADGTGGSVTLVDGIITFTPDPDYNGPASFAYTVSDGNGGRVTRTIAVDVAPVNDAPVAPGLNATITEDDAAAGFVLPASDVDAGAVLTTELLTGVTQGTLVDNGDGTVTFDPGQDFQDLGEGESRDVTFTYQVTDETGAATQASATIAVTGINDAPEAANDAAATVAGIARTIPVADLLANDFDVEGDSLTVTAVGSAIGGTVALVGSEIVFTHNAGFSGQGRFSYTVSDGNGGFDTATVAVTVLPKANQGPTAFDDFLLGGWQDDVLVAEPGGSILVGGDGADTLIGGVGNDTFIIDSADTYTGGGGSDTVIVGQDGPITIDMGATGTETMIGGSGGDIVIVGSGGGTVHGGGGADTVTTGAGNDMVSGGDGDDTIIIGGGGTDTVTGGPGTDSVVLSGGAADYGYTWVPGGGWVISGPTGSTTVSGVELLTFPDLEVELAANGRPGVFRVYEDVAVTIPKGLLLANDTDPDGDTLSIVSVQGAVNSSVQLDANGNIRFLGAPDYNGLATFTYTIADGNGGTASATVTVRIWPVNDAPVLGADSYVIDEDSTLAIAASDLLANDTDIDGGALSVTAVGNAVGGTVAMTNGQITFTPAANTSGPASFAYTVSDGKGGLVSRTVDVTVNSVNDSPVAGADAFTTTKDVALTVDVADLLTNDSDADGGALTVASVGNAVGGTVALVGGQVVFTPTAGFIGNASFTYTVEDGQGGFDSQEVSVKVTGSSGPVGVSASLLASNEFRVNTNAVGDQTRPSAAVLEDGSFVITWVSASNADGSWEGIFAQRYNSDGTKAGGEFRVNSYTDYDQSNPRVAALAGGGFVVVWNSIYQDSNTNGVFAQRYDSAGIKLGGEFRVNTTTPGEQGAPQAITALSDGGFIVAWQSWSGQDGSASGIYAQRYDGSGNRVGAETRINSTTAGEQASPAIASLADGGYVVAWHSTDGSSNGIFCQRFTAAGVAVGNEFRANSTILDSQDNASVTGLADGGFVVTWSASGQDAYGSTAVMGQVFSADGTPVGGEFRANSFTYGTQGGSWVTATSDGGFAVAWFSQQGGYVAQAGVYAQRFDAGGVPVGGEFSLAVNTAAYEHQPTLAARPDGGFVAAWTSGRYGENGMDNYWAGIEARIFKGSDLAPVVTALNTTVAQGDSVFASALLAEGHAQGNDYVPAGLQQLARYEFTDNTATIDSGYFTVDGAKQAAGQAFSVAAADLDSVRFVAGAGGAADSFTVRGSDGTRWSAAVSATATTAPQTSNLLAGSEFRVNTNAVGDQTRPSAAVLEDGSFVITWVSASNADGSWEGIFAQRYNSDGTKAGGEFRVNSYSDYDQTNPRVAALAGGGFVVTWNSIYQDGNTNGVFAQRYDSLGIKLGGEFQVHTTTFGEQGAPQAITALPDGGFVVAWQSWNGQDGSGAGIYAQRYDGSGNRVGAETRINSTTAGDQTSPTLTSLADGGYVVAWHGPDGNSNGIYGQRFGADGIAVGGEFRINRTILNSQDSASVTGLADGGFVVTWSSSGQDGSGSGVFGQRFDIAGQPIGGEFQINTYVSSNQGAPWVAANVGGGFSVAWYSQGQDGGPLGVYAQNFDAVGTKLGGEFCLAVNRAFSEYHATLAARPDGGFVAAWSSGQYGENGMDGYWAGIQARVYSGVNLIGGTGDDVLFGSSGNQTLVGGGGEDVFLAGRGMGSDVVDNRLTASGSDQIRFGAAVESDQLWFRHVGNDLRIDIIGTADSVTVKDWSVDPANQVADIATSDGATLTAAAVETLVSAMSAFSPPPAGTTTLDPVQYAQIETIIAAEWKPA
ncbi:MAG: tandem-95 repeat protein [Alphaproteobacteria bacterium]|nr:tandem-95 repeat protein [Alphaproteobacteria bacterium]